MSKRDVRIGNVSGATGDSPHAMRRMAEDGDVDVIVGDWLSEMNIAWNAIAKDQDPALGYEPGFLTQLTQSIDVIAQKGIRVITNAGALNTEGLAAKVQQMCYERGHEDMVVAMVLGDDISQTVTDSTKRKNLLHLDHPEWALNEWELEPYSGVAYIGAWGIVEAIRAGADIVICGRVTDASPVIGAAAWWHGWAKDDWDQLAGGLVAGHLIECGPYVTGANFSGFKDILSQLVDLAFPIAEIAKYGTCIITKPEAHAGAVTKYNTTSQFLYELQGEQYLNPDVVANLHDICIEEISSNRVKVHGITGSPPPPTTKAMIAAKGGYQAEATFYINGLDVSEKVEMMRNQLLHIFKAHNFSKFSIEMYGSPASNPTSQQAGTVFLRVFVQAKKMEDISADKFKIPIYALRMQSYPGYHMNLDFRTMDPKPFMEIFPVVVSMASLQHETHILGFGTRQIIKIDPPAVTAKYPIIRNSYETTNPLDLTKFGPTQLAPLGSIVHARSGDKADNSNIGFFVRNADEYPWLQSFLTIDRIKILFGDDWTKGENHAERRVERCEFPNVFAVHFRVLDFLDGGIASSSRIDGLGKGIGEYLRSKLVSVPVRFLDRGCI
ncbi:unnamed protein product [Penicillium salamii]|uniref:DUF1446-domain-containing protein n=1 Tax=Penicillium salamii TaxID=1612424 RepID=A0A9W4NH56_9EURO|nr:unnamed protein product [Penicillium salamii]CAG8178115.1 unnamed protein product [Penicillium salamii]CAG8262541.1 unnamed protein product [Penicillium salamii]CAG8362543.1 unnamed protein product [Penicillium salamii]CAG8366153.1 unnamed protein product [Penicillium salamii]